MNRLAELQHPLELIPSLTKSWHYPRCLLAKLQPPGKRERDGRRGLIARQKRKQRLTDDPNDLSIPETV